MYKGLIGDYNIYSVVHIGEQVWLGENLRYKGGPYYENPANPNLFYGCLYDWTTVMNIDEQFKMKTWNNERIVHQGIAPDGWHIPREQGMERIVVV